MSKLALLSVLAAPTLFKGSTQFSFVAASVVLHVLLLLVLGKVLSHHSRGVHGHGHQRRHGTVVVHMKVGGSEA